jgi:glutamate-1-semialdehyde 2,1-aminomutase
VFDEVKTGFRTALGGYQSVANVKPHLSVFGKAIANGYPLGVIGGKEGDHAII